MEQNQHVRQARINAEFGGKSPVMEGTGGWFFVDETWCYLYGPWKSEDEAWQALDAYCAMMLDDPAFEQSMANIS